MIEQFRTNELTISARKRNLSHRFVARAQRCGLFLEIDNAGGAGETGALLTSSRVNTNDSPMPLLETSLNSAL
jgi:hypothetical protein